MTAKQFETLRNLLTYQVALLSDIRDGIVAEASAGEGGCDHPEEKRVSLSSQGDLNHWVCALCKFDNKAAAMN